MTIDDIRDKLLGKLKAATNKKEVDRRNGYIDGVLDTYNEFKKLLIKE